MASLQHGLLRMGKGASEILGVTGVSCSFIWAPVQPHVLGEKMGHQRNWALLLPCAQEAESEKKEHSTQPKGEG